MSSRKRTKKIKGTKLLYTFKSDVLIKMLSKGYPHLLKRLVAALLGIPFGSIKHFKVINPEMPPLYVKGKLCRLDIIMEIDGRYVNLEIQVKKDKHFSDRAMYYLAKMFVSSLDAGEHYSDLPKSIIICIVDFAVTGSKDGASYYGFMELRRYELLSDKQMICFFELPKLPRANNVDPANERDLWFALFNAKTEEDLAVLEEKGGVIMKQAIEAYRSITADEEFRYWNEMVEKARRDEAQALYNAKIQGEKIGEKRSNKKWKNVVAEKEAALAKKDAALVEKDAALVEKDAIIAELLAKMK